MYVLDSRSVPLSLIWMVNSPVNTNTNLNLDLNMKHSCETHLSYSTLLLISPQTNTVSVRPRIHISTHSFENATQALPDLPHVPIHIYVTYHDTVVPSFFTLFSPSPTAPFRSVRWHQSQTCSSHLKTSAPNPPPTRHRAPHLLPCWTRQPKDTERKRIGGKVVRMG